MTTKTITILGGSDKTISAKECRAVRACLIGLKARYTMNDRRTTISALIHDGVPANWVMAIAKLLIGQSVYLDAGNFSYEKITRVA